MRPRDVTNFDLYHAYANVLERRAMTTDTPKPQEQKEPFTGLFVVLAVTAIDRSVLSYRVIDADRNTLADRLSKEQAQWLCDRLNSAPPPAAMESERADAWVDAMLIDMAELPDRTSPDDYPDMLMIIPDEMPAMLIKHMPPARSARTTDVGATVDRIDLARQLFATDWPVNPETGKGDTFDKHYSERPDGDDAAKRYLRLADKATAIIAAHSAPAALPTLMEEEQWQVSYAMRLVDPKTGEDGGDSTIAASRLRTCLFNVLAIIDHIRAKP